VLGSGLTALVVVACADTSLTQKYLFAKLASIDQHTFSSFLGPISCSSLQQEKRDVHVTKAVAIHNNQLETKTPAYPVFEESDQHHPKAHSPHPRLLSHQ